MKARLRKSKEDLCQDSLFWPTMPRREVVGRLDCRNCKLLCFQVFVMRLILLRIKELLLLRSEKTSTRSLKQYDMTCLILFYFMFNLFSFLSVPAISQHYIVPHPSGTVGSAREMRNNNAVYSLWSYFLDFLVSDPASVIRIPRLVIPPDANDLVNRHTGRRRLNLFIGMSRGKCAEACA